MSDWMDGWDGWLSYTAVTPRASLKSDANNSDVYWRECMTMYVGLRK